MMGSRESIKDKITKAMNRGLNNYSQTQIEHLFADLNYAYAYNSEKFDPFYYKHNALIIEHYLENFGITEAIIEDSLSDDYSLVYDYIMHKPMNKHMDNKNNANIILIMDFMWLLAKKSENEFDKYYQPLLEKLLTFNLHLTDIVLLFNYVPDNIEETDKIIINYVIANGDFFKLMELLSGLNYDEIRRRIFNVLPHDDKYNMYKLGVNI